MCAGFEQNKGAVIQLKQSRKRRTFKAFIVVNEFKKRKAFKSCEGGIPFLIDHENGKIHLIGDKNARDLGRGGGGLKI